MSIHKYDLILLGNLIVDEIYYVNIWPLQGTSNIFTKYKSSIGGVGNLIKTIPIENIKLLVEGNVGNDLDSIKIEEYLYNKTDAIYLYKSNLNTSKAIILSNLIDNERTSFVNWGCGSEILCPSNNLSKWTHISYLDTTSINLSTIRQASDIISSDLCLSNPSNRIKENVLNQLKYIDYLFISETEINAFIENTNIIDLFIKKYELKYLILHKKRSTLIYSKNECVEVIANNIIINNIDVLGAGDAYCANFIYYHLTQGSDNVKAAIFAHQAATNFISNQSITKNI